MFRWEETPRDTPFPSFHIFSRVHQRTNSIFALSRSFCSPEITPTFRFHNFSIISSHFTSHSTLSPHIVITALLMRQCQFMNSVTAHAQSRCTVLLWVMNHWSQPLIIKIVNLKYTCLAEWFQHITTMVWKIVFVSRCAWCMYYEEKISADLIFFY